MAARNRAGMTALQLAKRAGQEREAKCLEFLPQMGRTLFRSASRKHGMFAGGISDMF